MDVNFIGTLHDADGAALPGWHVNATGLLPGLDSYRVEPATPRRQYAGVTTYCYAFPSRAHAEQLLAGLDLSDPPAPRVRAVSMRQARIWLRRAGLRDAVEAAVAASPDPELVDWWDSSSEVHIDAPPLVELLPQLGIASEQLPVIFEAASKL